MHPIENRLKVLVEESRKRGYSNPLIRNILKEYLQDVLLNIIYNSKEYNHLIFYGGTCLRKIYSLNRLSEDLDFETTKDVDLEKFSSFLSEYFKKEKFSKVSISTQKSENIHRCTVKFVILNELGLSENVNEKLHVKIEINSDTKGEYDRQLSPYSKDIYSMVINHYTLPVCMAGKVVACLERTFRVGDSDVNIKGRDFYDLIWYMQKGIKPDAKLLRDYRYTTEDAFKKLDLIVADIKEKDILIDLEALFEEDVYIKGWCKNFKEFYRKYRANY